MTRLSHLPGKKPPKRYRAKPRPRSRPGVMNKTEAAFLQELQLAGRYDVILFEPVKLKLADKCWYHPDFMTVDQESGVTLWEVKAHSKDAKIGRWEDDARVKFKIAAKEYWWFTFVAAVGKGTPRRGFTWEYERMKGVA